MKKEFGLNIVIVFLAVLALGLGYLVYQQINIPKTQPGPVNAPVATNNPNTQGQQVSCEGIDARSFLRNPPKEGAPDEEHMKYTSIISCFAKIGDTVSLSVVNDTCVADPSVLSLTGYKVNVKNDSKSKLELRIITAKSEGTAYQIDPGKTQIFDLTGTKIPFHMSSCYIGDQRSTQPKFDGRTLVILTKLPL